MNATTTHRFWGHLVNLLKQLLCHSSPSLPPCVLLCGCFDTLFFFFSFQNFIPFVRPVAVYLPFAGRFCALLFLVTVEQAKHQNQINQTDTPLSKSRYSFPQLTVIRNRQSKTLSFDTDPCIPLLNDIKPTTATTHSSPRCISNLSTSWPWPSPPSRPLSPQTSPA